MNSRHLEESFRNTSYIVHAPGGFIHIRIGLHDPALDTLLEHYGATTWAFITAWNPGAIPSGAEQNERWNQQMRQMLLLMGFEPLPGVGAGDSGTWEEESLFVPGIAIDAALELGRRFQQAAIVVGTRGSSAQLLWC